MCGIAGYKCLDVPALRDMDVNDEMVGNFQSQFYAILNRICVRTSERGRDSWGFFGYRLNQKDPIQILRHGLYNMDGLHAINDAIGEALPHSAILNFRGEPTTEIVDRSDYNIQPFTYSKGRSHYAVAHNGIISNDKNIIYNSGLELQQRSLGNMGHIVDSYALLQLAEETNWESEDDFYNYFQSIQGSYAMALFLPNKELVLARNYRDLAVRVISICGIPFLFFASKPNYLRLSADTVFDSLDSIPPYTWIRLPYDGAMTTGEIPDGLHNSAKAIVVISGGLDSTTAATIACNQCSEVTLLHFLYDCLAESQEKHAVARIHAYLTKAFPSVKIKLEYFETDLFKKLGGSTITDKDMHKDIAKGDEGVETASEWVPARNTVMCAIAAAYCDRYDIGKIYLGLNMEESGAFADNTTEFYERMSQVTRIGTQARPEIVNPLGNMMKHEIVKKAFAIGAPIHLSWSCYHSNESECHANPEIPESEYCGPCTMKSRALKLNGLTIDNFKNGLV